MENQILILKKDADLILIFYMSGLNSLYFQQKSHILKLQSFLMDKFLNMNLVNKFHFVEIFS